MSAPFVPTKANILAVDDNVANLAIIAGVLEADHDVHLAKSGKQALKLLEQDPQPDLILLDVMMPEMSGPEVLAEILANPRFAHIPVIFVTAADAVDDEEKGLNQGAVDYITKPFSPAILRARIKTHLELQRARKELQRQNDDLEAEVAHRMRDIFLIQDASIRAMASMGETRDLETGNHIRRTQLYIQALGRYLLRNSPAHNSELGLGKLNLIVNAAPLHDIGKIGIPDRVLLKPGKLTAEEFELMKKHAQMGGDAIRQALSEARQDVRSVSDGDWVDTLANIRRHGPLAHLEVAEEIAEGHHEKWDGTGYPKGLKGAAIPLSARLMALADVFDALISKRVYKDAMPISEVMEIISKGRGTHFDPDLVDAFFACRAEIEAIAKSFPEGAALQEAAADAPTPGLQSQAAK